jgi:hypothetical protein
VARCTHITDAGQPCRAAALEHDEFCLFHSPARADAVQEARRLGGLRRRRERTVSLACEFQGLRTVSDILLVLESTVNETLALDNSIARSRALAHLCEVARRCVEADLEERTRTLEATVRTYELPSTPAFDLPVEHCIQEA